MSSRITEMHYLVVTLTQTIGHEAVVTVLPEACTAYVQTGATDQQLPLQKSHKL